MKSHSARNFMMLQFMDGHLQFGGLRNYISETIANFSDTNLRSRFCFIFFSSFPKSFRLQNFQKQNCHDFDFENAKLYFMIDADESVVAQGAINYSCFICRPRLRQGKLLMISI